LKIGIRMKIQNLNSLPPYPGSTMKDVVQPMTPRKGEKRRLDVRMTYVWANSVAPGFSAGFSGLPRFLREEDGMGSGVATAD